MLPFLQSAYFTELIEAIGNGIVIFNVAGEAYVVNRAAASILGVDAKNARGMQWDELLCANDCHADLRAFMQAAHTEDIHAALHLRHTRADGRVFNLNLTSARLVDYHKVFGIMVIMTDVTELLTLHERERAILREKTEVERRRAESMRNLADAVAHQIRNPVMTIGGFAALLRRKAMEDTKEAGFLDAIIDEAHKLDRVVSAVKELTGAHMHKAMTFDAGECVLRAVQHASEAMQATIATHSIEVQVDAHHGIVTGDAAILERALACVLINALEALDAVEGANPPRRIRVHGTTEDASYCVTIEDTGASIPPEVLPYIYDPFFTTHPHKSGMGLTIATAILREHHATLKVVPIDSGTCATVCIPLHRP